jgi:signal transduction histidine kinase
MTMAAIRAIQGPGTGMSSFAGWVATREGFSRPVAAPPRAADAGPNTAVLTTPADGILPFDSDQGSVEIVERDALESMSEAVLAIAAEREVDPVLRQMVRSARELACARFAALGIPDGQGAFAQFITDGMSDELIAAMGPLPRTHGLLGAMLESPESYRTPDIRQDPRFRGWWPRAHPQMRSFLGVPIVARGEIIAAFYLTDREGADEFSEADQRLIEMLAAHAALAIVNARLLERSRELSIVEERNRLARELHDAVSQKLFGLVLGAESAATLLERDTGAAAEQVERIGELAQDALEELRGLIFELRPASLEEEGLAATLRKQVDMLERVHGRAIELRITGAAKAEPEAAGEVLRIAQQALDNALRHADAERIELRLQARDGRLTVTVADDGVGFDPDAPGLRSRRLGLTSMEERARALGGTLAVVSRPGEGTTVTLELRR